MYENSKEMGPIFIGGPDRCGKTTMQAFLVSHPRISIPNVGSNMWTYFYGQFGDLGKGNNFERCLESMLAYKHVRYLQPDPDRIRREFKEGAPTYARLFELFQQYYAERAGKPRWGVQTGLIERYAGPVMAAYPKAKMLHMIRDPRDRYQASLALWPDGKGRAGGATARWLYSVSLARRNLKKYPGRYKVVQFEALVRAPERTLQDVCQFLGEEFVPDMLTMSGAPERRDKLRRRASVLNGPTPLSDEFIGIYRETIPKSEIAFMQQFAGKQMLKFGYGLDPVHFSLSEKMHYGGEWPLNLLRMVAWLSLEQLQHKFPVLFGRKPDKRLIMKPGQEKRSWSHDEKGIHTKSG